jgi:hypothetical protein
VRLAAERNCRDRGCIEALVDCCTPPPPRPSPRPQSALGADVHALVVRTGSDVLVVFRGMDSRRDVQFMDTVTTPSYDAAYYGDKAKAYGVGAARKLADGKPNPDAFWVLDGYTVSYESMHGPIMALLKQWEPKVCGAILERGAALRTDGSFGRPRVPLSCNPWQAQRLRPVHALNGSRPSPTATGAARRHAPTRATTFYAPRPSCAAVRGLPRLVPGPLRRLSAGAARGAQVCL